MGQDIRERNFGPQPLDKIMADLEIANHALVAVSPLPLTHKAVQRARKGRWLTPSMRRRITTALNLTATTLPVPNAKAWTVADLFNYHTLDAKTPSPGETDEPADQG